MFTKFVESRAPVYALYKPSKGKRHQDFLLNPDEIVVVGSNSSRRATDEELYKDFGLIRCEDDYGQQIAGLEQVDPNLKVLRPSSSNLMPAPAVASTTSVLASATDDVITSERLSNFDGTNSTQQTPT
ncbi:uncharacterized protein N7496_011403 [Penicillium cataractarum]|uniref:Uncharacterized protein n=1 Tax=Penicillium cataractarum TaxID=2100454 RepID=A0A9W9UXP8_9EURO|nr:uncharacterized protein N7496_011403 [Penicillium cataractarum]KAJ5358990.1 hypothetical protein N7496_011403 [Penicillium cataractarum]